MRLLPRPACFVYSAQVSNAAVPVVATPKPDMSEETLSRADVESLLQSRGPTAESQAAARKAEKVRVLAYDFKRPERIGKDQMRALQSLHESLARGLGAALSAALRTMVEVRLISVDQLTYSEFIYSLEVPTCYNLLQCQPLQGNWLLDLSPTLLYPIIDRMLGGVVDSASSLRRPLSEIELRLAGRITNIFLRELQQIWENVVDLDLKVERVESNPQLVQIVPPNEVVISISFEVTMGAIRGMTNLCIPYNTIETVGKKLSNNSWISYASVKPDDSSRAAITQQLRESEVEMRVFLATSKITTGELFDLQVGDIINTEKDIHLPLEIEIAGATKFLAAAGTLKGRKAARIEGVVREETVSENADTPTQGAAASANVQTAAQPAASKR